MRDHRPARAVLFEDGVARQSPLTDLRPAWDVRLGACTVRERLENALKLGFSGGLARPEVAAVAAEGLAGADLEAACAADLLVVSARCALAPPGLETLAPGQAIVEPETGALVAARLAPGACSAGHLRGALEAGEVPPGAEASEAESACLLRHPWDVIRFRDAGLAVDLAGLIRGDGDFRPEVPEGVTVLGRGAAVHLAATVFPTAVLDCTGGPVVIDRGAVIRPGAILVGPVYVGPGSTVLEHALIKANTAIGPVCKVAGEVGGTIFQGHANKAHDGHLGDSWVGEWVNLGAGTTNSNLLNTYGEVVARSAPEEPRVRTGLTFLGAIFGDHVKTAISTRIMTGSVLGTGSMVASTAPPPTTLGAFTWLTDAGSQAYRLDKCLAVARHAMGRRGVTPSDAYIEAFGSLHARIAAGRGGRA
jgi:UDP-N-acetylglucosamine diphosphorylase/glucosamine-1-phosphate N-acetyltransferase